MIQLSGRFLKYNIIDKNGVQFPKSATIKIPSKVFVLFNFDKSHPIGIAEVIKDEEGLLAGIDDVLGVLKDDKVERQRGIGMTVTVFIVLIMTIFWMLLQFILPGLNDTLCIIFYYLTMCLLGMWCFYYIGVVMAEMR